MKHFKRYFLFSCLILCMITSCKPPDYLPVITHTVPSGTEKNSAGIALTTNVLTSSGHLSYAFTDNVSVTLSGMAGRGGRHWESGLLYSTKTDTFPTFIFQAFAGYGSGFMEHNIHKETGYQYVYYQGFYNKYLSIRQYNFFAGPNIGIWSSKKLGIMLSVRGNYWIYPVYDRYYAEYEYQGGSSRYGTHAFLIYSDSISYRDKKLFSTHITITLMGGGKYVKSITQAGVETIFNDFIINRSALFYIRQGIIFNIPFKKRKPGKA